MKLFKPQGQSLMEAVIAVAFISSGVLAVVALVVSNVQASKQSALYTQASILAWEGFEVVRSLRDSNWLDSNLDWDVGLNSPGGDNTAIAVFDDTTNIWSLDYTPNTILLDSATKIFRKGRTHLQTIAAPLGSFVETPFFRLIKTEPLTPDSIRVISEVRWREQSNIRSVKVEEIIFDWR
jgi:hypothetical protein